MTANASELSAHSGGAINQSLATILATRYADALLASGDQITDETRDQIRDQVKLLRGISREVARLGRCQHDRDRVHIQRERLDLARERFQFQLQHSKIKNPNPKMRTSPPPGPEMTEEEKARKLKEFIFPRRLFPEKYPDEQARRNTNQPIQTAENRPNGPKTGQKLDASNKNQTITS